MRPSTLLPSIGMTVLAFATINCGPSHQAMPVTGTPSGNAPVDDGSAVARPPQSATAPAIGPRKSPTAYGVPTAAQITAVLNRVHGRLNALPVRIVVRQSRTEVTDFSIPMAGLATDPGPEGKFGQLAYAMG